MAKHVKPTKEQLLKGIEDSKKKLKELEKNPPALSPTPTPTPTPTPSATPSPTPTASPSATPSPTATASPSATPSPSYSLSASASVSPSKPPKEDELEKERKKSRASSREAQVLYSRTKKYDEAVEEAEAVQLPDDKTMQEKYGKDDWEGMSSGQQLLAKEAWVSNKRFEIMSKVSKEGKDIQEWNKKVDKFIEDPKTLNKYKELEGKQDEFKEFCSKPTRRGLDFEDLVLAFNGELAKNPPKKNKGKMFERGVGGDKRNRPKPNDGTLTAAQGRALMKTDYKKWKQLLMAGKISNK